MDLLNMLLGSMTSAESIDALSEKTGASSEQSQKLIVSALPLLLGGMTSNASSKEGARSLLDALQQHTETTAMARQIGGADVEDGDKIVHHIFGNDSAAVIDALAKETDLKKEQVTRGLASLAPALLSVLFAAANSAGNSGSGFDLGGLLNMFGGSQQNAANSLGLLGSLLGISQPQQPQELNLASLLGTLMGGTQQQSGGLGGLLGGLLGGGMTQQQPAGGLAGLFGGTQQQQPGGLGSLLGGLLGGGNQAHNVSANTFNGLDLLNILTSLMR